VCRKIFPFLGRSLSAAATLLPVPLYFSFLSSTALLTFLSACSLCSRFLSTKMARMASPLSPFLYANCSSYSGHVRWPQLAAEKVRNGCWSSWRWRVLVELIVEVASGWRKAGFLNNSLGCCEVVHWKPPREKKGRYGPEMGTTKMPIFF
jgi:hypothetical protein